MRRKGGEGISIRRKANEVSGVGQGMVSPHDPERDGSGRGYALQALFLELVDIGERDAHFLKKKRERTVSMD